MNHPEENTQESQLTSKENSIGPVDIVLTTKSVLKTSDTETGKECIHHWIIEYPEKGKTWLDAQCKKCFKERKYKSTMLTKYTPDQTKIKVESLDTIIAEETRKADKEDEQEW